MRPVNGNRLAAILVPLALLLTGLAGAVPASAKSAAAGSNEHGALCDGHTGAAQQYATEPQAALPQEVTSAAGGERFEVYVEHGILYLCGQGAGAEGFPEAIGTPATPVQVAASDSHAYVRLSTGAVYEWEPGRSPLTKVALSEGAAAIAAGPRTAAAVLAGGHVETWGEREYRQGCTSAGGEAPREMEGVTGAKEVSLGYTTTYVLSESGEVSACTQNTLSPVLSGQEEIGAGWFTLLSRTSKGVVYLTENHGTYEAHKQTELGESGRELAAGEEEYAVLEDNGHVYTMGNDIFGMLGTGLDNEPGWHEVKALSEPVTLVAMGRDDLYIGGGGAPVPKVGSPTTLQGSFSFPKLHKSVILPATPLSQASEAQWGPLHGSFATGRFTAPVELFGVAAVTLGLEIDGAINGYVGESVTASLTQFPTLHVDSVSMFGLTIRTSCSAELTASLSGADVFEPTRLAGPAALGGFTCKGGLLGSMFGYVLGQVVGSAGTASLSV